MPTPQGAITSEAILMKLDMVDYVQDPTPHDSSYVKNHLQLSV